MPLSLLEHMVMVCGSLVGGSFGTDWGNGPKMRVPIVGHVSMFNTHLVSLSFFFSFFVTVFILKSQQYMFMMSKCICCFISLTFFFSLFVLFLFSHHVCEQTDSQQCVCVW